MKCPRCHKDVSTFTFEVVGATDDGRPIEKAVCDDCRASEFVVDPTGEAGTYPTIQAALDAANAEGRGRITIRPSTHEEA